MRDPLQEYGSSRNGLGALLVILLGYTDLLHLHGPEHDFRVSNTAEAPDTSPPGCPVGDGGVLSARVGARARSWPLRDDRRGGIEGRRGNRCNALLLPGPPCRRRTRREHSHRRGRRQRLRVLSLGPEFRPYSGLRPRPRAMDSALRPARHPLVPIACFGRPRRAGWTRPTRLSPFSFPRFVHGITLPGALSLEARTYPCLPAEPIEKGISSWPVRDLR